jgi:hypothetical protein
MSAPIKQLAVIRRRSGQTVKEFLDYHYQQHGAISRAPKPEETPQLYFQTHFFDTAYNNSGNAQPAWTGHNDSTELWFENEEHMSTQQNHHLTLLLIANNTLLDRVFGSDHVRNTVGPDGSKFNDFVSCIAMFAQEETLSGSPVEQEPSVQMIVATYYVQARDDANAEANATMAKGLNPEIVKAFGTIGTKIVANIALPDPGNRLKYFQGVEAPVYSAAYQVCLSSVDQIPAFREAQRKLEKVSGKLVKTETAFVTFGVRSVVFDQTHNVVFDGSRQPRLIT